MVTLPATTRPLSGSKRKIDNAVIDLPQPDSPTNAKVSPRAIVSDSRSTARTRPDSDCNSVLSWLMAIMRPPDLARWTRLRAAPGKHVRVDRRLHVLRWQTRS